MQRFFILFLCLISMSLSAKTMALKPAPMYWLVQHVYVKANSVKQYEAQVKELVSSLESQNRGSSPFSWFAFASPEDAIYTYVTPVDNLDHLEEIYEAMAEEANAFSQLHESISGEVNSYDVSLMQSVPSLCYTPASSNADVQAFNIVENIEVAPGQEEEFESIIADWVQSARGTQSSISVFETLIGSDLPLYTIVHNGASLSDFRNKFSKQSARGILMSGDALGVIKDYSISANTYVDWLSNVNE